MRARAVSEVNCSSCHSGVNLNIFNLNEVEGHNGTVLWGILVFLGLNRSQLLCATSWFILITLSVVTSKCYFIAGYNFAEQAGDNASKVRKEPDLFLLLAEPESVPFLFDASWHTYVRHLRPMNMKLVNTLFVQIVENPSLCVFVGN